MPTSSQRRINHTSQSKAQRNQSMECCKMLAAILVVFLHVEFPHKIDGFVKCFSCFAVPVFFAITGYFNYGADQATLTRRLKHNLGLYLAAILAGILYGIFSTEFFGGSTIAFLRTFLPEIEEWAKWLIFHVDPRSGQLWYLTAACMCYLFLRGYVRFFGEKPVDYRPLYVIALCLFSVFLALGILAPVAKMDIPYLLYRNGYFMGLPFFTLGIFIHEYQEQVLTNFHFTTRKQILCILAGILLGFLQWKGIGMGQMTVGALLEVFALMFFLVSHPRITSRPGIMEACIAKFGSWSTWIYLLHIIALQFYTSFLQASFTASLSNIEPYVRPLIVVALAFFAAIVCERGEWLIKQIRKRKS